jgi:hypothetical protein
MRRFLAAAVVFVVLAAAPAVAAASADQQLARAGVLQRADFPSGWKQTKRVSEAHDPVDREAAKIPSCKPFAAFATANRKQPHAASPNFELGQSTVSNTVSVYATTDKAEASLDRFRDTGLPKCLDRLFDAVLKAQLVKDKQLAKQLKSVSTDVALETGFRIGDDVVVYEGTTDVTLKNRTVQTIGLGFVTVRVGTALAGYSYTSDTDISAALQPAIIASVTRLQRAAPSG